VAISRKTGIDKRKIFKMSPAPSTTHQRISGNLHGHLFNFSNHILAIFFAAPFDVRLIDKKKSKLDEIYTVVLICV
jgi:hypothetical protein